MAQQSNWSTARITDPLLVPLRWAIRLPDDPPAMPPLWSRYLRTLAGVFGITSALLGALVALVDPYGSGLPTALSIERPPMNGNQRFMFPAMVRSGQYDSYVIGMSSSRPLDPIPLAHIFGGRFAHLGMNGATPWEQRLMGLLAARHWKTNGGTLLWSLDRYWCFEDIGPNGHRDNPAPEWLYDDNVWNDLAYLFNGKAVDSALTLLRFHLGYVHPKTRADGFLVETPDEKTYDLKQAREKFADEGEGGWNVAGPEPMAEAPAISGRFPAIAWLDEVLTALPAETRKLLVLIPPHVANLPSRGSQAEARVEACKSELVLIAHRRGAFLVDFRVASALTTTDENFWDGVHFRRHVGPWIIDDLKTTVIEGRQGKYSILLAAPQR